MNEFQKNNCIEKLLEIIDSANDRDQAIETAIQTILEFINRIESKEELKKSVR